MFKVYMAMPLDYAGTHGEHLDRWFHNQYLWPQDAQVYCPHCSFKGGEPAERTMHRNNEALLDAHVLVAIWDGTPSFGVPIEVWQAVHYKGPDKVCLVHTGKPGLFVRYLSEEGVAVVDSPDEALMWVRDRRAMLALQRLDTSLREVEDGQDAV